MGEQILAALAFADGLILCGNVEDMDRLLKIVDGWRAKNYFAVNAKKSSMLAIGHSEGVTFQVAGIALPYVDMLRYLGFIANARSAIDDHAEALLRKAWD